MGLSRWLAERARGRFFPVCLSDLSRLLCLKHHTPNLHESCAHPSVSNLHKSISCKRSRLVALSVPTDVTQAAVWGAHLEKEGWLGGGWVCFGQSRQEGGGRFWFCGSPRSGPRELWYYLLCTWLVMVFVLGIQLKPNVCWQSGLPSPHAFLFYLSVLSAPSSTALSS